jgi:hypothetical protein
MLMIFACRGGYRQKNHIAIYFGILWDIAINIMNFENSRKGFNSQFVHLFHSNKIHVDVKRHVFVSIIA